MYLDIQQRDFISELVNAKHNMTLKYYKEIVDYNLYSSFGKTWLIEYDISRSSSILRKIGDNINDYRINLLIYLIHSLGIQIYACGYSSRHPEITITKEEEIENLDLSLYYIIIEMGIHDKHDLSISAGIDFNLLYYM